MFSCKKRIVRLRYVSVDLDGIGRLRIQIDAYLDRFMGGDVHNDHHTTLARFLIASRNRHIPAKAIRFCPPNRAVPELS